MTRKSVEILIEADNQATKELKKTNQEIKRQVGQIQQAGTKAKASTELVGTFAAAFGGDEVASFAGEVSQLSDRLREFGEVGKQGAASSLAFKAALAGGVAVIAAKIGMAIGNWAMQTEKWNRELEKGAELSDKLASKLQSATERQFQEDMDEISIIVDPEKQEAELRQFFDFTKQNLIGTQRRVRELRRETEEWADAWQITGNRKALAKMAEQELEQAEELLEIQERQADSLRRRLSSAQQEFEERKRVADLQRQGDDYLQALRDELELLKATKEETFAIMAARNTQTGEQRSEAERLLREKDAIQQKAEAEKQAALATQEAERAKQAAAEQSARARENAAKRLAGIERSAFQNLQQQVIELVKGKVAARQFALQSQGLDEETAAKIAQAEEKLNRLRALKEQEPEQDPGAVQAVQSRLLTRGRGNSLAARETEAEKEQQKEVVDAMKELRDAMIEAREAIVEQNLERQQSLTVKVVK